MRAYLADGLDGGKDERAVVLDGVEDEELADGRADGHGHNVRHDRRVVPQILHHLHDLERHQQAQRCGNDVGTGGA